MLIKVIKFIENTIGKLIIQGCIKETAYLPHCYNPITIAKKNLHLQFPYFKYEDIKVVKNHLKKDFFFTAFDLKSVYHHISIHQSESIQVFLGHTKEEKQTFTIWFARVIATYTKRMKPLLQN